MSLVQKKFLEVKHEIKNKTTFTVVKRNWLIQYRKQHYCDEKCKENDKSEHLPQF